MILIISRGEMMKEKILNKGSILTAFIASLCCIGPIVFAILGLSGAGIFIGLESYRPYLIVLTIIFLGISFYLTYRKREVVCEDGSCIIQRGSKFSKLSLWTITLFVGIFLGFPFINFGTVSTTADSISTQLTETTIPVEGMTCASCNIAVETAVNKLDGIHSVKADFENNSASVIFDNQFVSKQEIIDAINSLGYQAGKKNRESKYDQN
jgi:mercuric ion transport protein